MSLEVKFGSQQKVYVTYVATNCTFFVQLDTNEAYGLNELSQKISSHIESGGRKKLAPDFGIQCYAFSDGDQMWYRALISKVSGSKVTVFYVDYGNTEVISVENLSLPSGPFFETPYQGVCCTLGDFFPLPDKAASLLTDALSDLLLEQEFSGVFQSRSSSQRHPFLSVLPCYNVCLFPDGNPPCSIATFLVEQGMGQYRISSENIEIGSKQSVYTCFVDSPGKFWIQLSNKVDFLQSVIDDLNAPGTISSLKRLPLSVLVPGVACCTQFSEDERYYRAEIVNVSPSRIKVCFVDYGNCEVVEPSTVFQIPVHMAQSPFCAVQCCLEGVQPIKRARPDPKFGSIAWTTTACDKMMELTDNRELEAHFVADISDEIFSIHLTDVETQDSIGEKLAEARVAEYTAPNPSMLVPSRDFRYLSLEVGETYKNVFISFTESPAVVWCQRNEYSTELSDLVASLAEKGPTMLVVQNPIVDQTCCVQYELDHSWCRGVVQSVDQASGTAQILFVDYGNTETINLSEIRSLQSEFYTLPAQAISFSMAEITPRGGEMWNTAAIKSFKDLVYEQSLHAKVVGLDQDGYPSAKLIDPLNGNMDVGLELVRQGFAKAPWNSTGNEKTSGRNEAIQLAAQLTSSSPQHSYHSRKDSDSSSTHSQNFRSRSNEKRQSSSPRYRSNDQSPYHGHKQQSKKTSPYQSHRESPYNSPKESPFHSRKQNSRDSSPSSQLKYHTITLEEGQTYDVSVCHVELLTEFYCQLSSEMTKLNDLMRKIHDHCNSRSIRKMKNPKIGLPVLALFSEDRVWYRARICGKQNTDGSLQVVFTDFGNTETVSQNSVALMPPPLLSLPAHAIQCSLFGVPSGTKPSEKAINAFGELTIEQNFQLVVKQSSKDVTVVELLSPDNSSVLDQLIKNGHLPPTTPTTSGRSTKKTSPKIALVPLPHVPLQEHLDVVPSFIESPTRFYVQLTDSYTGLEKLSNELNEFYQQLSGQEKTVIQPEIDQFCAMRFSEDGLWYRARITQVFPHRKCVVCYIDYGNSETVNTKDLKALVPEFTKLPCFGISCSLEGLPASSAESPAVTGKFLELVTDKQLVAQFKKSPSKYGEFVPVHLTDTSTAGCDLDIVKVLAEGGLQSKQDVTGLQIPSITPVFNSPMECQVTFVNSPGDFYLQLVSESEHIDNLLNKMYAFYAEQNESSPLSSPSLGSYCAAPYSDGSWYRGKITSITSQGAMVFYFDFGNTDEVVPANLCVLDPQFISMPAQALKCSVSNVVPLSNNWSDECNSVFSDLILEKTLQVSFLKQDAGGRYETHLLNMGEDVALKLCEVGVAQKQSQRGKDTSSSSSLTVPPFAVKTGVKYDAYVTSVISPLEFYCQLVDPEEKLDLLMMEISEHCRNTRPSTPMKSYSWKPGDFALALFSQDETWYRAVVTKVLKGGIIVEVHYVDYGNNEMISQTQLLPIKREFCTLPSQAIKCCLEGSQHYSFNKESIDQFSDLLLDQEFVLKCLSVSSDSTHRVDLNRKSDDIDMMSLVIQENMVTPQKDNTLPSSTPSSSVGEKKTMVTMFPSDVVPDSYHDVTVVYGENPSLFYCQFSLQNADFLEGLMTNIQSYYNAGKGQSPTQSEMKKGLYVVAQYSEDERWYRAQVEEATQEGVRVTFVDYGNSEVIGLSLIKHLTSDFSNLPAQAVPCSLADIGPLGESWNDEVNEIFLDLVLEKTLVAQVKSVTNFCNKPYCFGDEQTLAVSLIESSEEIASKLVEMDLANNTSVSVSTTPAFSSVSSSQDPTTSSAGVFKFLNISRGDTCEMYISSAESPSAFWLQKPSAEDTLAPLQDKLMTYGSSNAQILSKPSPGSICCAKFSEDNSWYRGVVKSVLPGGVHVCFMDYGNSEVIPPSDVKVLLPEFLAVPVQAIECKLSNCNPLDGETNWSDDAIVTFSDLVSDKLLTVGFVCRMYNTWDVNLFDGDLDIASQLLQKGVAIQFPLQVPTEQQTSLPEPVEISRLDLEVGRMYPVYIAFNDTPSKFYCQLVSECDKLESLMAEIADFYNGNHLEPLLEEGAYCVAQYSGNCAWYRARVIAVNDKEDVEVHFIDYGNSEHVSGSQILALGSRFASLPAQAFCCSLIRNLEMEFPPETMDLFFSYDLNQEFRIKVTAHLEDRYIVDLFDQDGSLINATLLKTKDSLTSQPLPPPPPPPQSASYTPLSYSVGTSVDVYVTCIVSPTSFFCQPLELTAELENMMMELSSVLSTQPHTPLPLAELASGKVCVARYSFDNEWYRAVVEEIISEKEVLVSFVDYGNSEVISLERVAHLPVNFLSTRVQSLHCSVFEGLGVDMEWSEEQVAQFQSLIPENEQHNLKITGTSKNGQYFVEVTTNGDKKEFSAILEQRFDQPAPTTHSQQPSSLRDPFSFALPPSSDQPLLKPSTNISTLALKGSQTPSVGGLESGSENGETEETDASEGKPLIRAPFKLSLAVQEVLEVNVVYTQSPSLLYIQRLDCQNELFTLSDEIQQYCASFDNSASGHQAFREGDFVLAKYVVDDTWYRAEVSGVDSDGTAKVQFIDYGNEEVISPENLVMCPENFLELPVQAIPCSLSQVPARDSWPISYRDFINNLVEEKALRVTVVLPAGQGMRPTINLEDLESGVDISQKVLAKLQEECESGSSEVIAELPEGEDAELLDEDISLDLTEKQEEEEEEVGNVVLIEHPAVPEDILPPQEPNMNLPEREFTVGMTLEVYMISCFSPHSFVCQLASDAEVLDSITTHLAQLYTSVEDDDTAEEKYTLTIAPKEGGLVVGQFSEDDQWYRAKILAIDGDDFEVQYIDFGNSEHLQLSSLRRIDSSLISYPPQAIECYLTGIEMPSEEGQFNELAAEKIQELIGEDSCNIEVVSIDTAGHLGVILTTVSGLNVGSALIENKLASPLVPSTEISPEVAPTTTDEQTPGDDLEAFHEAEEPLPSETTSTILQEQPYLDQVNTVGVVEVADSTSQESVSSEKTKTAQETSDYATSFPQQTLSPKSRYKVKVTFVATLEEFMCQLQDHSKEFQDLQYSIASRKYQSVTDELTVAAPKPSMPVCACSTKDEVWYRGEVISMGREPDTCKVYYVDLGHNEVVPLKRTKYLEKIFAEALPPLSVKCCLPTLNECDLNPSLEVEGDDAWELMWPTTSIRHFSEVTTSATEGASDDGGLYLEIMELTSMGSYLVKVIICTPPKEESDVRDMLVAKLREPKHLTLDSSRDDSMQSQDADGLTDDPLATSEALKAVEREIASATPPPTECVYEISSGNDSVSLGTCTIAATPSQSTGSDEQTSEQTVPEKEPTIADGVSSEGSLPIVSAANESEVLEMNSGDKEGIFSGDPPQGSTATVLNTTQPPELQTQNKELDKSDVQPIPAAGAIETTPSNTTLCEEEEGVKIESGSGLLLNQDSEGVVEKGKCSSTVVESEVLINGSENYLITEGTGATKSSYVPLQLSIGQELLLLYMTGSSPSLFVCLPFESCDQLATVMDEVKEYVDSEGASSCTPLVSVEIGEPVIAQFSEDSQWYRGEVVSFDLESKSAHILFVDYGNSEDVSLSTIYKIPQGRFLQLPKQAVSCSLFGVKPTSDDGSWESGALEKIEELANGCEFITAKVVSLDSSVNLVTLKSDTCVDFGEELVVCGLAGYC